MKKSKKPKKPDWKTPAVLIGLVVVAIVFFFFRPREPEHEGRSLTEWIADLDEKVPDEGRNKAREAVRHMGTNTIPALFRILSSRSGLATTRMPGAPGEAEIALQRAVMAFQALGPAAFPILTNLLVGESGATAAYTLSKMGPEALPPLLRALTNTDVAVRYRVELGLELDTTNSQALKPVLMGNLKHPDDRVRAYAARALSQSSPVSDDVLSALIAALEDTSDEVRLLTVEGLGRYGTNATQAIPPLLNVAKASPGKVSRAAYTALAKIAPEAAKKAGVR